MEDFKILASQILKEIDQAQNILLCCHYGPDLDSIGSNLAMKQFLEAKEKKVTLICPDDVSKRNSFFDISQIEIRNITTINQDDFDLFISLDCGDWRMISREVPRDFWEKPLVVLDHHSSNDGFGTTNLIIGHKSSTCEVIYDLLILWKAPPSKDVATLLLSGIYSDSGGFHFPITSSQTLKIAGYLLELGADLNYIVDNLDQKVSFGTVKYWGLALSKLKVNEELGYVWSVITKQEIDSLGVTKEEISGFASRFLGIIDRAQFGFCITEQEDIYCSFRGKNHIDTTVITKFLGGGGHKLASGFLASKGMNLLEVEALVHKTIRDKYAQIMQGEI